MRILVAYDIPSDRRRKKISDALERIGRRVQWSVFVTHRATAEEIVACLEPLLDPRFDDVRVHPLCAACEEKARLLGLARAVGLPPGFRVV